MQRRPACATPAQPTEERIMKHNGTRLPFRDWCVPCISGKAPDWPHSRITHPSTAVPECHLDILTVLNFLHCPSGASFVQCSDKGPATHVVQAVTTFMDFLGLKMICLRTDGEPAWGALAQAIKSARRRSSRQRHAT